MRPLEKDITVNIRRGIHGRVASSLARIAAEHDVRLFIVNGDREIDCSSILDVLSMAFVHGTQLRFRVHGHGADKAITAVEQLFTEKDES